MARYWFGDSDDWSLSINGDGSLRRTPSTRKYYDAETGGVQHSDLLINGTTPADSVASSGLPVRFQGPDGVLAMWESANNGPRVLVQSTDIPQVVTDAADSIVGVESVVTDARDEAVAAAAVAVAPTATVVDAVLTDPSSDAFETLATFTSRTSRPEHAPALGLYFPEAEGAAADGVVNDTAAITAAVAAAAADGGGVVSLDAGKTYSVTSIGTGNRVTLRGGHGTVLKLRSPIGMGVITIGAHDHVTIENLKIDGNRANVTAVSFGILKPDTAAATNLTISNVWVTGTGYIGIGILGPVNRSVITKRVVIEKCLTTNTGGHGIITQNAIDDVTIDRCTVETFGRVHADCPGITGGRNSYAVKVVNCTVNGKGVGGTVAPIGSSAHGISLDTTLASSLAAQNIISDCPGLGLEIGFARESTVVGNTIRNCANAGIGITGNMSDAGLNALGQSMVPQSMTIAGNTVTGCARGVGTIVGTPPADSAIAAWKTWGPSTAYSINDRIVFVERLYEATTAGTTGATTPATLGATVRTNTVADNTVTWTDRGPVINGVSITGNQLTGNTGGGVELFYCYNFAIVGNTITRNGASGVYINSNSNMGTIVGNVVAGNCVTDISGAHANIRILTVSGTKQKRIRVYDNQNILGSSGLQYIVTEDGARIEGRIRAGDTTPTVCFGDAFFTANTAPTVITNFDDANTESGRIIAVRIADAFTTLVHGGLDLAGDVNYSPPSGSLMTFAYMNGQWRELSRTAP